MAKYDFLIVGAGLFGVTCARLLTDKGFKCLIVEKEKTVGGMAYTERTHNIDVHKFGAHIFHTSNDNVWQFVNKYATFKPYTHNVLAYNKGKLYHLPINLSTIHEIHNVCWPNDAQQKIDNEVKMYGLAGEPKNLEEYALSTFGVSIYNILIKEYTEKQWNTTCDKLPIDILSRIPIRYTYNNNYFTDKYQGIPDEGYTALVENIIGDDIDIILNTNFIEKRDKYIPMANTVIFSGQIDELCDYCYGTLEWRSLLFAISNESEHGKSILGTPVVNFTSKEQEWTRIIEHKWFTPYRSTDIEWKNNTIITYEYPDNWEPGKTPFYPINTTKNKDLYNRYFMLVKKQYPTIILGGRLGTYTYMNMDETINSAFLLCSNFNIDKKM